MNFGKKFFPQLFHPPAVNTTQAEFNIPVSIVLSHRIIQLDTSLSSTLSYRHCVLLINGPTFSAIFIKSVKLLCLSFSYGMTVDTVYRMCIAIADIVAINNQSHIVTIMCTVAMFSQNVWAPKERAVKPYLTQVTV